MPAASKLAISADDDPVVRRLRQLVNHHFDGNMSEAAQRIGVPYDQLRRACLGHNTRGVPFSLLIPIAKHFKLPIRTFTGGK